MIAVLTLFGREREPHRDTPVLHTKQREKPGEAGIPNTAREKKQLIRT